MMIKPGIWRTRGGALMSIEKRISVRYMGPGGPGTVDLWKGKCLDCGERFNWYLNGSYSPVQEHALDIMSKANAQNRDPRSCEHFESHEVLQGPDTSHKK